MILHSRLAVCQRGGPGPGQQNHFSCENASDSSNFHSFDVGNKYLNCKIIPPRQEHHFCRSHVVGTGAAPVRVKFPADPVRGIGSYGL